MARRNDRSLGIIPLLIMAVIWGVIQNALVPIGLITSRAGYFRQNEPAPKYGCPIPQAAP